MRISRTLASCAIVGMMWSLSLAAGAQDDAHQEKPEPSAVRTNASKSLSTYRVDFVLSELVEGKKVNSRSYSIVTVDGEYNKLRTGARYPVATGNSGNAIAASFQYLDIGVNIDCHVEERAGMLQLVATIDSSSASWPDPSNAHSVPGQPIISQIRSDIRPLLRPGVTTMVSSMDDPVSKRRFQFDVTASKVN